MRAALIDAALAHRSPLKLNFVYSGRGDEADLGRLLDWAGPRDVVVGVLDDLGQPDVGSDSVLAALGRLRAEPTEEWIEHDPHSLPTLRRRYRDGLVVEVKTARLGEAAPWRSCGECAIRGACREGIAALRLTHEGVLRPCMDRADLGVSLVDAHRTLGAAGVTAALHELLAREAA